MASFCLMGSFFGKVGGGGGAGVGSILSGHGGGRPEMRFPNAAAETQ